MNLSDIWCCALKNTCSQQVRVNFFVKVMQYPQCFVVTNGLYRLFLSHWRLLWTFHFFKTRHSHGASPKQLNLYCLYFGFGLLNLKPFYFCNYSFYASIVLVLTAETSKNNNQQWNFKSYYLRMKAFNIVMLR